MDLSPDITLLATALSKAQGQMQGAVKDSANPFFKSKYADLASVWDACRKPLTDNGLSILQSPRSEGTRVEVETLLMHTSGQWIRDVASCTAKDDSPQSVGSATTYLRRYALQSFAGVAPEDDDAEAAQGRGNGKAAISTPIQHPAGYLDWLDDLAAVATEGTLRLEKTWKTSKPEYRQHLTTTNPKQWDALKRKAAVLTNEVPA